MICIVLLVGLVSSLCGVYVAKKTAPPYEAEENGSVTIGFGGGGGRTNLSSANVICFFWSEPLKVVFEMINGANAESQDPQFAGRVWCDQDALADGRIRLRLSGVTTNDSGSYWCDVAANFSKGRWELEISEAFVLNVTRARRNRDRVLTTSRSTGEKETSGKPKKEVVSNSNYWQQVKIVFGYANVSLLIAAGLAVFLGYVCQS